MQSNISDKRRNARTERGFTLIEVLIVVAVLGILAAIATFAVTGFTGSSIKSACKADFSSVQVAVDSYKAQEGLYPTAGKNSVPAGTLNAVPYLMLADTTVTPNVGPWLHNNPVNGTHYRIEVSADGKGTVQVYTYNDTTSVAANQIPASAGTATSADCNSVS